MQQHPDGPQRPDGDLREARRTPRLTARMNRRSISAARALRARITGRAVNPAGSLSATLAAAFRPLTTAERALPVAVAAIVALASLLAVLPGTPQGAVGGTQGSGAGVRIAVGGGAERPGIIDPAPDLGRAGRADIDFQPVTIPEDVTTAAGTDLATTDPGPILDDGTLLTGYAPSTTVEDGSELIRTYRVRSGDTLVTIARHFGISMMTLWWANKLTSKDDLHIGQELRVPTVDGIVVTVTAVDTLESLAAAYDVTEASIVELNDLEDPTLVVGQVLVLPDAKGAPIPTPKPTPKPVSKARTTSGGISSGGPARYSGGAFRWPVVGGNNYISQYYHGSHHGLDIAADYGSRVIAAAGGRVIFAGWRSNGGGWQVWISHGSGLYTTYNHLSGLTVGSGQGVGRGQQVGRVGQSGRATGPHLHFEVWLGGVPGGTDHRVNPLRYL